MTKMIVNYCNNLLIIKLIKLEFGSDYMDIKKLKIERAMLKNRYLSSQESQAQNLMNETMNTISSIPSGISSDSIACEYLKDELSRVKK